MTTELLLFKVLGNKNSTKEMAAEQEGPLYFCRSRMKDNRLRNIFLSRKQKENFMSGLKYPIVFF